MKPIVAPTHICPRCWTAAHPRGRFTPLGALLFFVPLAAFALGFFAGHLAVAAVAFLAWIGGCIFAACWGWEVSCPVCREPRPVPCDSPRGEALARKRPATTDPEPATAPETEPVLEPAPAAISPPASVLPVLARRQQPAWRAKLGR